MADATSQLLNISKTSLLCSICNARYKEPKLLQCLHTFCQKCLAEKLKTAQSSLGMGLGMGLRRGLIIECPLCKEETDIPNNNLANLKTNFRVVGLIEDAQVQEKVLQCMSQGKAVVCEACDLKNKAVSRCFDCSMFICKGCQTVHRRIAACSQHTISTLDDLICSERAQTVARQQGLAECSKHPGCKVRSGIYCETCKELVCKDCAVHLTLERSRGAGAGHHLNHQCSRLESAAAKKKSAVRQMISQLENQRLAEFKSAAQSIATKGSEFHKHTFELERQVKNFANKIRVDICAEEASLLQTISKIRRDQDKIMENCGSNMNTAVELMIDSIEAAQEILDNSEDGDFLTLCPILENGLESHMNMRPSDIFQGLPHWSFNENTSATLVGTLRNSSGCSYREASYGQFGQDNQLQSSCAIGGFAGSSYNPRKKSYRLFGGTQPSAQVASAAVKVNENHAASDEVVSEDSIEQLPSPPSWEFKPHCQEANEKEGKLFQEIKTSFTSNVVTAAIVEPSSSGIPQPEDEEELMYEQRAHIYHFASDLGIWKETGIGHVKLLRHKAIGALRLVMELQQESKLVANNSITSNMKLDPLKSSDRSWVWTATDYSDGKASYSQQFSVKFKTSEFANEFKQCLKELQAARKVEEEEIHQPIGCASLPGITIREEEELMYKQQAAICYFARLQRVWKQRDKGIGDVKILRHKNGGALRLIIQCEQDLNICWNHSISTHMKINLKSPDKWVCRVSPSAGEAAFRYLLVKFATSELAKEFKRRLEELQAAKYEEEKKQNEAAFAKSFATFTQPHELALKEEKGKGNQRRLFSKKQAPSKKTTTFTQNIFSLGSTALQGFSVGTSNSQGSSTSSPSTPSKQKEGVKTPAPFGSSQKSQQGGIFGSTQKNTSHSFEVFPGKTPASFNFSSGPSSSSFPPTVFGKPAIETTAAPGFDQPSSSSFSPCKPPFIFGQASACKTTASLGLGASSLSPGCQSVTNQKENDVHDGGKDDVIFLSEKIPTPDQRARAEALLLPPNFFLYEDEPPCPGCRGCEPDDLAERGKCSTSLKQPDVTVSHLQPSVVSTASCAIITKTTTETAAQETPTTVETQGTTKSRLFPQAGDPVFDAFNGDQIVLLPEAVSEDVVFKRQMVDWQCEICLLNNSKDVTACTACMTLKPGAIPQADVPSSLSGSNL